jgi:hypothetical protein
MNSAATAAPTCYDGVPSAAERHAARELFEGLKRGEYCCVLAHQPLGDSFLMAGTAARAREHGIAVATLSLRSAGKARTSEQWYECLLRLAGRQLGLAARLQEFWRQHADQAPLHRWLHALQAVVLGGCPGRILIFIDEIDAVRQLPFSTDEFFAGIRYCYNRRSEDREFARLTFCLMGSVSPTDLIRNRWMPPFNIGRRIDLEEQSLQGREITPALSPRGSGPEVTPA